MIDYIFYELPPRAPSFKSYKGNELEGASKDFELIKGFDDYVSVYLMKITAE